MPLHPREHLPRQAVAGDSASQPSGDQPSATAPPLEPRRARLRLRVTFGFVISAVAPGIAGGAMGMAQWGAIVFVSLLAHELGHALMGLLWGSRASIVLYPLLGITRMDPPLSPSRSIAASFMGPLVNLLLGLVIAGVRAKVGAFEWLGIAMWVNLGWGALNLLPVLPFDGGRVLLTALGSERATKALIVSASVAAGVTVVGLFIVQSAALSVVFGAASIASVVEWVKRRPEEVEAHRGVPEQLVMTQSLLAEDRCVEARQLASAALGNAQTQASQRKALELLAWSLLGLGRPERARETLARVQPANTLDVYCWAAVEDACGRGDHAIAALERARGTGALRSEGFKLLIELYARRVGMDVACRAAQDELRSLAPDDARRVLEAALDAEAFSAAADLAGALFKTTASPDDGIAHAYGLVALGKTQEAKAVLGRVADLEAGWELRADTQRRLRALTARAGLGEVIEPVLSRIARLVER